MRIENEKVDLTAEGKNESGHYESRGLTPKTPEEEILETREGNSSKSLGGGTNKVVFVEFKDDGAGVFKPKSGETLKAEGIERGTFYKRERAAYLVDRFFGFGLVPPTVIREIDGDIGSVQQFIPTPHLFIYDIPFEERGKLREDLTALWFFDYIIWNSDRHAGNFLIKADKVYAIDNGCAFAKWEDKSYFYPYAVFYNEPIAQSVIEKINKFLSWEEGVKILRSLLEELLLADEVASCVARIKNLGKLLNNGPISSSKDLAFNP